MEVVDLNPALEADYLVCLEEWNEEFRVARAAKEAWVRRMLPRGLSVKIALDGTGTAAGMIETMPIEHGFARGEGLHVVNCIWVHGYADKGRGDLQGKGLGKALLQAAEAETRHRGAAGLAAWGVAGDFWMPANWFRRRGFLEADVLGGLVLLWKPFAQGAAPPRWIRGSFEPVLRSDRVTVTAFRSGQCCSENAAFLRAQRAVEAFGEKAVLAPVDMSDPENRGRFGLNGGIYVEGENLTQGPPPPFEVILRKIDQAARAKGLVW